MLYLSIEFIYTWFIFVFLLHIYKYFEKKFCNSSIINELSLKKSSLILSLIEDNLSHQSNHISPLIILENVYTQPLRYGITLHNVTAFIEKRKTLNIERPLL